MAACFFTREGSTHLPTVPGIDITAEICVLDKITKMDTFI